jgi:hypothetical protein
MDLVTKVLSTRPKSYEAYRVCLVADFVPPSELQEEINLMKNQIDSTEKWKGLIYPEEE